MLTYKYSIDEVYDRPLVPVKAKAGRRSWLATVVLIPVLVTIGLVLLLYSPIKVVQLTLEKFSHQ